MPKPKITESDLCRAAKRLRTSTAEVETVAQVESAGDGFYADGFPTILFERHLFRRFTQGKFNKSHPHLSGPQGGYGKAGQHQKDKFNEAFGLDPIAAMKACSWGKFQILGSNYEVCGFNSVGDFVDAMKESEGKQLDAFCEFVIHNGLGDELRNHNWAGFARGYNGPAYKKNKYDEKLASAYEKFKKRKIICGPDSAAVPSSAPSAERPQSSALPSSEPQPPDFTEGERPTINIENAQKVINEPPPVPPKDSPVTVKIERVSIWAKVGAGFAALTGLGINLSNVIETKLNEINVVQLGYVLGGIALIALALWAYDRAQSRAHEKTLAKVDTASDPSKNTVTLER